MIGGAGNDTYHVDVSSDLITELAAGGSDDRMISTISNHLPDHVEHLTLAGSRSIDASGNSLDNHLLGNIAANVLDGGLGSDTLEGGLGNDTYYVDDINDVIIDSHGVNNVYATLDWTLGEGLSDLTLLGMAQVATGNAGSNGITGNANANVLDGGAGIDELTAQIAKDAREARAILPPVKQTA